MRLHRLLLVLGVLSITQGVGCGHSSPQSPTPAPSTAVSPPPPPTTQPPSAATAEPVSGSAPSRRTEPVVRPELALLAGLMPLRSTGVDVFRAAHPTYDGRGVLIGILDSGIDPGVAGLIATSTGAPKLVDARDFSGEGRIDLAPATPAANGMIVVGGRTLRGAARIGRLATTSRWYVGLFRELPLGALPAADVNGNGTNTDEFPVVVVRAPDGWVVFFDSNRNGTFEDEQPLHDYRQGRETIALGRQQLTLAANFADKDGVPQLDLHFDTSGHGTHVAGIAAGRAMFNLAGFDGVAPGAQLLSLKIANDARGGISVTGSMQRAMEYAVRFATERGLPLVLNLSFGVGNEAGGRAAIDSLIDAFLRRHPDVVFAISAGNDGPGLSTMGFPASADLALSVGALEPGAFTRAPQPGLPPPDRMGWWSSRGGVHGKPDLLAPGVAYSTVPRWNLGEEIKSGTSMAAPHVSGLVACLLSAMAQEHRVVSAADVMQALRATAARLGGWTTIDQGAGVPVLAGAYRWLVAGHQGSRYVVRDAGGGSAVWRSGGFAAGDTVQLFTVTHADGLRAAQFRLSSDSRWLSTPAFVTSQPRGTTIPVVARAAMLPGPGAYVGTITARSPSDSLAGPLFSLVTTVVVPYDIAARPLDDPARAVSPARVQRYFLRVPLAGTTMRITTTLADADEEAMFQLYDPAGRPVSADGDSIVQVGFGKSVAAAVEVPAEDAPAGVYELDILNPGTGRVTASVRAELAAVSLAARSDGGIEATNPGGATATLVAKANLVGAERRAEIGGASAKPESLMVLVPAWATRGEVVVEVSREQWDRLTDLGLTLFDSLGQQVNTVSLNHARARHSFEVPSTLAGRTTTVELFPAFAVAEGSTAWRAAVRIRFFTDSPQAVGDAKPLSVVAGGRVTLRSPSLSPTALTLPVGFTPVLEWRLSPAAGSGASAVAYQPIPVP